MTDPIQPPTTQGLESIREDYPELYTYLSAVARNMTAIAQQLDSVSPTEPRPDGPRNVAVNQLGGKLRISWDSDPSATIEGYRVARAAAGTRAAPTTPLYTAANQAKVLLAQNDCMMRGSKNEWVDENFAISDFKTDNPSRFSYWVQSFAKSPDGDLFSVAVAASGSPIELLPSGHGEITPNPKTTSPNKLVNGSFRSNVTTADTAVPQRLTISATTNASPIEVTTTTNHGMLTGDRTAIINCDAVAANGFWTITKVSNTKFTLDTSVGTAVGSAGFVFPAIPGQPALPSFEGAETANGSPVWSPWVDQSSDATARTKFASDGTIATGEVIMEPPTGVANTTIGQAISIEKVTGGEHYTFSVYARLAPATSPGTGTLLTLAFIGPTAGTIGTVDIPGSHLTTTYQRFWITMVVDNLSAVARSEYITMSVFNIRASSGSNTIYLRQPMFNTGDFPAIWTDTLDQSDGVGTTSSAAEYAGTPDYTRTAQGSGQIDATYA